MALAERPGVLGHGLDVRPEVPICCNLTIGLRLAPCLPTSISAEVPHGQ
jgi:hypothetical protein